MTYIDYMNFSDKPNEQSKFTCFVMARKSAHREPILATGGLRILCCKRSRSLCLSCQRVQQVSLANAFFLPYLSCLQPTSDGKTNVGNSQRTVGEKKTENKPIEQWCCYSGKVIEGKYKRI